MTAAGSPATSLAVVGMTGWCRSLAFQLGFAGHGRTARERRRHPRRDARAAYDAAYERET